MCERAINAEKTKMEKRAITVEKTRPGKRANILEKTRHNERAIKIKKEKRMIKKVKLMDLVHAPELQVREINPVIVGNYSESIKAGAVFPPLMIDEKNRIIAGYHRFGAYKKNFEPDALIECEVIKEI